MSFHTCMTFFLLWKKKNYVCVCASVCFDKNMKHKKEKDKVNDDRIIIIIILTFLCKLT